jgi:D-alanine--D-alanine ligase
MSKIDVFKLAVICGGPSLERGVSLNSARSVMDHLASPSIEIIPLYVDSHKRFYRISSAQLYSNTPADFDFKLNHTADLLNSVTLQQVLQSVDLVFPVIHGKFGEDGELQKLLEDYQVPFVGHSSVCCRWMFHKYQANQTLQGNGFSVLPQLLLTLHEHSLILIERFFYANYLKRAIVKPTIGGSSIGVYSVSSPQEAYEKAKEIFTKGLDHQVIIEAFCVGKEFTLIVCQNPQGQPVALLPSEIEISYEFNQIFDYQKKYLPSHQTTYHNPPRFSRQLVDQIRIQAEQIFLLFGMRDFVRLDGWVAEDGSLYFIDINPISGLEQNSFFFRQTSLLGMTHRQSLEYIVKIACQRYGIDFPTMDDCTSLHSKLPVYVLFGNRNTERQVSLMSGINVWLKLLKSSSYCPTPFFMDSCGMIWELPYSYTLNHTVEEIYANCIAGIDHSNWNSELAAISQKLQVATPAFLTPFSLSLMQFIEKAQQKNAFVFISLHGAEGEDGTIQGELEKFQIPFNGSNAKVSAMCIDKYQTGQRINSFSHSHIFSLEKKMIRLDEYRENTEAEFFHHWNIWCQELKCKQLIIKPRADGCSAGIVLLQSAKDFARYCQLFEQKVSFIPCGTFSEQNAMIQLSCLEGEYLLEPYIETDEITIQVQGLRFIAKDGWIELTVGVLEQDEIYQVFYPSITLAEGAVLSVEEKFQGGTGINITPPPEEILSQEMTQTIQQYICWVAQQIGIQNYARIDIFFNRITQKMVVIEVNTLPALTASTVLYQQALAENPPLPPLFLLDTIISSKLRKHERDKTHAFK